MVLYTATFSFRHWCCQSAILKSVDQNEWFKYYIINTVYSCLSLIKYMYICIYFFNISRLFKFSLRTHIVLAAVVTACLMSKDHQQTDHIALCVIFCCVRNFKDQITKRPALITSIRCFENYLFGDLKSIYLFDIQYTYIVYSRWIIVLHWSLLEMKSIAEIPATFNTSLVFFFD